MNMTVNTTTGDANAFDASAVHSTGAMSTAMKTYYDTELLENARPRLIFTQLGKSQFLPAGHGDSVQWRKWNTFDKSLTPLTEGVIPSGQKFGQSAVSVSVQQYGDYAAISDRLNLHAVDNVILGAAEEMGAAGGETADTLVRNELCTGTSVLYADTVDANGIAVATPEARYELSADNNRLTPDVVNKAYTFLKKQKAPYFEGGKYVAVIHPSVSYDLRSDESNFSEWDATGLVSAARSYDTIVISVYDWHTANIAKRLQNLGKKVIIFSVLSPVFVLDGFEWADTIICGYSYSDYSFKAMWGVLNGEFEAEGKIPLDLTQVN